MPSQAYPRTVRRKRRRLVTRLLMTVAGLLAGLVAVRLAWFWYLSDPRRSVTIGPKTTHVTGPLRGDGTVDYIAAVDQRYAAGATPENNAVIVLWQVYGRREIPIEQWTQTHQRLRVDPPAATSAWLLNEDVFVRQKSGLGRSADAATFQQHQTLLQQVTEASESPWIADDHPLVAELLAVNSAALDRLVEASGRPRYYSPLVAHGEDKDAPQLRAILLPLEQLQREGARQLTARAMLRLGEGNVEGAWVDLLACHKLARLVDQGPFLISSLVAFAIESLAFQADANLIASDRLTAEQAQRCLRETQSLPAFQSVLDKTDETERMMLLDFALNMARGGAFAQTGNAGEQAPQLALPGAIDWDIVLRMVNAHFDRLVEAARIPDEVERAAALKALRMDRETRAIPPMAFVLMSFAGRRETASRLMGQLVLSQQPDFLERALEAEARAVGRERALCIGFALAAYQREHDEYPETLDALVPHLLPELPIDPATGRVFGYERTAEGFALHRGTVRVPHGAPSLDGAELEVGTVLRVPVPAN